MLRTEYCQGQGDNCPRTILDSIRKPFSDGKKTDSKDKKSFQVEVSEIIHFEEDPQNHSQKDACHYSISSSIEINSHSSEILFYKIRTTAPEKFQVVPTFGLILPLSSTTATVKINPGNLLHTISYEKFQVLLMLAPQKLLAQRALLTKLKDRATSDHTLIDNALTTKLNNLWAEFVSEGITVEPHEVRCTMNPVLLKNIDSEHMFGPVGISLEGVPAYPVRGKNFEVTNIYRQESENPRDAKLLGTIEKLEGCVGKMEKNMGRVRLWLGRAAFVAGFVGLFASMSFLSTNERSPGSCHHFEDIPGVKQNVRFEYIM
ncbi:unnamed protein product [Allacma fusca]|uniref:MSP domain-containing protein n=1 Tax=Allacma fusca TaxID=39272 RepID=A0A8J2K1Q6_9HEXA|nr:unnamed protein product [Allacma fusca]